MKFNYSLACAFILLFILTKHSMANAAEPKNHFQAVFQPRFFDSSSLGTTEVFSDPGTPEMNFRVGLLDTKWRQQLLLGFSLLRNNSKTRNFEVSSTARSSFSLYGFELGARQSAFSSKYFPLVPYLDLLGVYQVMIMKTKTDVPDGENRLTSTRDFRGGEFGLRVNLGARLSIVEISSDAAAEMEGTWGLKDFGLDFVGSRYIGGVGRTGSFKQLSSLGSFSLGGGIYVGW